LVVPGRLMRSKKLGGNGHSMGVSPLFRSRAPPLKGGPSPAPRARRLHQHRRSKSSAPCSPTFSLHKRPDNLTFVTKLSLELCFFPHWETARLRERQRKRRRTTDPKEERERSSLIFLESSRAPMSRRRAGRPRARRLIGKAPVHPSLVVLPEARDATARRTARRDNRFSPWWWSLLAPAWLSLLPRPPAVWTRQPAVKPS
jgi:hypothetical protein